MSTFLDESEIVTLTGRKLKSLQIDALRRMGLPFYVNATGHPVVVRSAIEGKKEEQPVKRWIPKVLRA